MSSKSVHKSLNLMEFERGIGGKNSPICYIPEWDPIQEALEKKKKATYFKLTLPSTQEQDEHCAVGIRDSPADFTACACSDSCMQADEAWCKLHQGPRSSHDCWVEPGDCQGVLCNSLQLQDNKGKREQRRFPNSRLRVPYSCKSGLWKGRTGSSICKACRYNGRSEGFQALCKLTLRWGMTSLGDDNLGPSDF